MARKGYFRSGPKRFLSGMELARFAALHPRQKKGAHTGGQFITKKGTAMAPSTVHAIKKEARRMKYAAKKETALKIAHLKGAIAVRATEMKKEAILQAADKSQKQLLRRQVQQHTLRTVISNLRAKIAKKGK